MDQGNWWLTDGASSVVSCVAGVKTQNDQYLGLHVSSAKTNTKHVDFLQTIVETRFDATVGAMLSALAAEIIEAWNSHDPRRVAEYFSDDYEGEDSGLATPIAGKRGVRRFVAYTFLGMPDLHFTLEQTIEEGNTIVLLWHARGTHKGKFLNIPATDRAVSYHGTSIFTISDGKVTHSKRIWDMATVLRQIGLLPELPEI